jgi:hypothetical protein
MHSIVAKLSSYLGEEKFAKLMNTLKGQCQADGRLLFWQEKLLSEFIRDTGSEIPLELSGILALFRVPAVEVDVDSEPEGNLELQLSSPLFRHFRWVKPNASGGSHTTVFSVELSSNNNTNKIEVLDRVSPHDQPQTVSALMAQIAKGALEFTEDQRSLGVNIHGLQIALLDFVYDPTDLKPYKYCIAMRFILEDLLCELRANRNITTKLLGVPI